MVKQSVPVLWMYVSPPPLPFLLELSTVHAQHSTATMYVFVSWADTPLRGGRRPSRAVAALRANSGIEARCHLEEPHGTITGSLSLFLIVVLPPRHSNKQEDLETRMLCSVPHPEYRDTAGTAQHILLIW